jgi:hypothetical protein
MLTVLTIMVTMFFPLHAQSENDFEVKQNADNTLTIIGYNGTEKNVLIPDTLYGLKVTIIGKSAFQNKGLNSVVIPDTVTSIEDGTTVYSFGRATGAFSNNDQLTKVVLGNSLRTIGNSAFASNQIVEIIIPNSVINIGEDAFRATKLTKITFGTGLQAISRSAFMSNEISELDLPSSLIGIGERAFQSTKIAKVTFGTGLQTIGSEAFRNNLITELNLSSSLKFIGGAAFANNQIQSIIIPNSVIVISSSVGGSSWIGAFASNPLTTVVIPASLANEVLTPQSFGSITNNTITSITIPARMSEATLKGVFEEAFVNFWINQNRASGTYIKRGSIWAKE